MTFSITGGRQQLCLATALMSTIAVASLGQAQEQSGDPPAMQHDVSSMDMGDHAMTPAMFKEFRETFKPSGETPYICSRFSTISSICPRSKREN